MPTSKTRTYQYKRVSYPAIAALALSTFLCSAYADDPLTDQELTGRKIYREGNDGSNTAITAVLGDSENPVSASIFPCANCHGLEGEGKQEGGLTIPSITPQQLFKLVPSDTSIKKRYTDTTLTHAITRGSNYFNQPLNAAMPKYRMTTSQVQALVAYLKRIGSASDNDVGITPTEVLLGTLLPLTGVLAETGQLLKLTMEACIAEINAHGPLYGRKLSLTVVDSGTRQQEISTATARLMSQTQPFAMISGYFPEITPDIDTLVSHEKIPVIAPLTFAPAEITSPSTIFYFLPSYADQSRALIDYWLSNLAENKSTQQAKLAIIYSNKTTHVNVVSAIREQLRRHKLEAVAQIDLLDTQPNLANNLINKLKSTKPDAIFFLGDAKEFATLSLSIAQTGLKPVTLGLLAMLGADIMKMPDQPQAKLLLASPYKLDSSASASLATRLDRYAVSLKSPGLQSTACTAINFFSEGLKRTGKRLSRSRLIDALADINNYPATITPPLQFSPNNRQGVTGAYVLSVDANDGMITAASDWITPSDNQE